VSHELGRADALITCAGTAVALTSLLGIPFARLRAALPDELLSWDLSTAMGRAHLFSKKGMDASLATHRELIPSLFVCCTGSSVKAADDAEQDAEDKTLSSEEDTQLEELVGACLRTWCSQTATCRVLCRALTLPPPNCAAGTAIVLAFLQVAALMPVTELAARISAAKRHFAGCVTPAGWDFAKTQTDFVTLLSPGAPVLARGRHGYCTCVESAFSPIGTLNGSKRWLVRARLWRLILSQNTEGWCAAAGCCTRAHRCHSAGTRAVAAARV
jgi:hypothetical protein